MFTKRILSLSLMLSLTAMAGLLFIGAAGQSQRPRRVSPSQNPAGTQPKPTPTPTPRSSTSQTTQRKAGETPSPDQNEVIRISSNLVAVPVSVTDSAGQPVRDLAAGDFLLDEEGKSQQLVTLGAPGKTPVDLALLFDVSGSVFNRFQFEQQAASRFLKEVLRPIDAASVFTIGFAPKLVKSRDKNVDRVVTGVMSISPTKEATAFFDSIVEAARYLANTAETGTRRVLVVISDGEDTLSERYNRSDAMRELQRTDCLFYSINPSGPSIRLNVISTKGQQGMTSLASATGGAAFVPDKIEDLDAVFHQIANELQAQYLLGYYSTDDRADGGFRRISVRLAKRSDLRVRARQGYYAPKA